MLLLYLNVAMPSVVLLGAIVLNVMAPSELKLSTSEGTSGGVIFTTLFFSVTYK
jgi:hypothetical protein